MLAGKEYSVRQLSLDGFFPLVRALGKIFNVLSPEEVAGMDDWGAALLFLAQGIPEAEDDLRAVLADALDVSIEEAGRLPATGMIKVVRLMVEQEDLKDLFFEVGELRRSVEEKSSEEKTPSPE